MDVRAGGGGSSPCSLSASSSAFDRLIADQYQRCRKEDCDHRCCSEKQSDREGSDTGLSFPAASFT